MSEPTLSLAVGVGDAPTGGVCEKHTIFFPMSHTGGLFHPYVAICPYCKIAEQARELSLYREWRDAVQGIAVDAGVVITDDPIEDVRLAIEFRDTAIAEQAAEIERLKANIANWERKEIRRASDCHGQEQRAEKAERERDEAIEDSKDLARQVRECNTDQNDLQRELDEARKALVWFGDGGSHGDDPNPDFVQAAVRAAWEAKG